MRVLIDFDTLELRLTSAARALQIEGVEYEQKEEKDGGEDEGEGVVLIIREVATPTVVVIGEGRGGLEDDEVD